MTEGDILGEFQAHHDHPGDPEKDDIEPGGHQVCRVESL
ncbi:hypothetical protein ES703_52204 [subsurface metagenome]